MAKNKKTKKQKIIADLRRQLSNSQTAELISPVNSPKQTTHQQQVTHTYNAPAQQVVVKKSSYELLYPFVYKDLQKTAFVTFGILLADFVLYFILNNHVMGLSNAG